MGKEIGSDGFTDGRLCAGFSQRLELETAARTRRLREAANSPVSGVVAGFELEAWLIDEHFFPGAAQCVVSGTDGQPVGGPRACRCSTSKSTARRRNCALQHCRSSKANSPLPGNSADAWPPTSKASHSSPSARLPTLRERDLSLASMSPFEALRGAQRADPAACAAAGHWRSTSPASTGSPLTHADVMLEAATTSFQVHLQTPASEVAAHLQRVADSLCTAACSGRQFALPVRARAVARNADPLVRADRRLLRARPCRTHACHLRLGLPGQ
jgi:hypothetical protein